MFVATDVKQSLLRKKLTDISSVRFSKHNGTIVSNPLVVSCKCNHGTNRTLEV